MESEEQIKRLAESAARCGLRLRDARFLFDTLYVTGALVRSGGNQTKAAEIAGVNREALIRMRDRKDLPNQLGA